MHPSFTPQAHNSDNLTPYTTRWCIGDEAKWAVLSGKKSQVRVEGKLPAISRTLGSSSKCLPMRNPNKLNVVREALLLVGLATPASDPRGSATARSHATSVYRMARLTATTRDLTGEWYRVGAELIQNQRARNQFS
jgi:hypothetical protein